MAKEFQEQLIEFLPKMRIWALALTRNRAAAEDLAQDVATKALVAQRLLHAWHQFLGLGPSHHDQSLYQRRAQPARISPIWIRCRKWRCQAPHEDRTALRELGWALDRLPRDQREALFMIVLQEKSYETAAEVTGCAIGTLKSRVHRARVQLRAYLTGEQTRANVPAA